MNNPSEVQFSKNGLDWMTMDRALRERHIDEWDGWVFDGHDVVYVNPNYVAPTALTVLLERLRRAWLAFRCAL
jgi:hypothetical protein